MFDDLTKDIKAQLAERLRSPLLGAFVIAWAAWNFKSVLVLFSTMSIQEKLDFWATHYSDDWKWISRTILYPLGTTVAFLLLYPYPARWAYHYWHWQHKKLKQVQQRIDDETPMTLEEAKELRRSALEQQSQMQVQLRSLADVNRELVNQREALLTQVAESRKEANARTEEARNLTAQLQSIQMEMQKLKTSSTPSNDGIRGDQPVVASGGLPADLHGRLHLLVKQHGLNDQQGVVFYSIVKGGGRVAKNSVYGEFPKTNRVEIDHAIDHLERAGLVIDTGPSVVLSDSGRQIAVDSGMTKHVDH